ncbi:uncharacterized protein LOC123316464 [Coccinella septempunctata]|uniref:uncharacterized protein LOC123316464 n=1 Tax=Coccinella septempunctata TaxID=41139 RepID=UPI001D06B95B|nr:uncharacterized protein LOC123316464 [Coccinella septempunctata]XP_044758478.1 uncharacterized protein LOC123316464 [Coccinella septempunctata]XP_044758479.1 uncharacterized protein LOC123316464 [Coccinella septempunctata]XP_044758480.1 uncharacterized protein LOC123316464 [Coccinella septempunctata]XP_044758481.1 uncharacterized protein LOC123316464 [Coccinella septempunctata]
MSQRVPSRNRAPSIGLHQDSNFYHQDSNVPHPSNNKYVHHYHHTSSSSHHHQNNVRLYRNSYSNTGGATTGVDTGLSDDTDVYYEYYNDAPHYQNHHGDRMGFSEDSGSVRLPLYESEDGSASRNNPGYGDRGSQNRRSQLYRDRSSTSSNTATRDLRRVYPNAEENSWGRMYQEVPSPEIVPHEQSPQLRTVPVPSGYHRPQSPSSSAIGSTVVDGCGGKCQTCENVCYFFLQLVFTMGILIGVSLCIAGTVLRKSAAKNLQVLVYIGALVSMVSALLLCIQCNARKNAKNRKKALWNAKRAPIPMETLNVQGGAVVPQQQPLVVVQDNRTQRVVQLPQGPINAHRFRNFEVSPDSSLEEQGIPWWRRKEMN